MEGQGSFNFLKSFLVFGGFLEGKPPLRPSVGFDLAYATASNRRPKLKPVLFAYITFQVEGWKEEKVPKVVH